MTKKDLIVDFVALHGKDGARFVDIQKFIFEYNHPNRKYDWWTNRGYYSCAFWDGGHFSKPGHLITGPTRLVKINNKWYAERNGNVVHDPREVVWEN